tara:strand:+ start:356 stop:607 length:252 start_codon:yes stop_codon:yes gene_type:complete
MLYKVKNKKTKKEQVLSSEDLQTFFRYRNDVLFLRKGKKMNEWNNYDVTLIQKEETDFLETFIISVLAVTFVVCMSKIILQWI